MAKRPHQLQTLTIGDEPDSWRAAGFVVDDNIVAIANTVVQLVGAGGDRGILSATLHGPAAGLDMDGMPFDGTAAPAPVEAAHPNVVIGFDHLVAMSPAMDRTTAVLTAAGLDHRRTRTFETDKGTTRQEFFWLGDVILELVGDDTGIGPGPAVLWGLAFTCRDLDEAAIHLGAALGEVKPAVQRDRRIATVRTRELDISVPIALMSPHAQAES